MKQDVTVIIHPLNRVVTLRHGMNLLDALREAGITVESICGGKGECGKCRIIVERGSFTEHVHARRRRTDRESGVHLACEIAVTENLEITIPVESRVEHPQILLQTEVPQEEIAPAVTIFPVTVAPPVPPFSGGSIQLAGYSGPRPRIRDELLRTIQGTPAASALLTWSSGAPEIIDVVSGDASRTGAAVDLGTTTVAVVFVDLAAGRVLGRDADLNTQITYGEELITRIAFAKREGGLATLQQAAASSINRVIHRLARLTGIAPGQIQDVCLGGNTVMNHLVMGRDPAYLEMVDADVPRRPFIHRAKSLGLDVHPGAYCFCLPNVSRFVGGDAVGDVLTSRMHRSPDIALLIDLGTNGEIVLGNRDWLASVSCASGPAFEGAGISHGMRAMRGAIEHVTIDPATGAARLQVVGNTPPRGFCGSGLIDAVTGMFRAGILDFKGKIVPSHPAVRAGPEGPEYRMVPKEDTDISRDIVITQRDMDYFMDSKAALCGAIGVLLKKYRVQVADVRHVYLAGAFGAFTDMQNAVAFGIIPSFPNAQVHGIGNGSLSGSFITLLSSPMRTEAQAIADMMVYIDLLVDPDFIEEYTAALSIPGKKELFPDPRE
ncbi:MAG: ASKHA domain-containing protein [Methanomicrobiales archaeon]|nr:ASKHA domain-containing protein [Methanomicrobiales archaeon]